jgi:hypothetical protein
MNLPAWNADASLYQTSGRPYRTRMSPQTSGAVSPARLDWSHIFQFGLCPPGWESVCRWQCVGERPKRCICDSWETMDFPGFGKLPVCSHETCYQAPCTQWREVCECWPQFEILT